MKRREFIGKAVVGIAALSIINPLAAMTDRPLDVDVLIEVVYDSFPAAQFDIDYYARMGEAARKRMFEVLWNEMQFSMPEIKTESQLRRVYETHYDEIMAYDKRTAIGKGWSYCQGDASVHRDLTVYLDPTGERFFLQVGLARAAMNMYYDSNEHIRKTIGKPDLQSNYQYDDNLLKQLR